MNGTGAGGFFPATTVTLTASDGPGGSGVAATEYRLDGGPFTPYTGPCRSTTDGPHRLEFRSRDVAGNEEPIRSIDVNDRCDRAHDRRDVARRRRDPAAGSGRAGDLRLRRRGLRRRELRGPRAVRQRGWTRARSGRSRSRSRPATPSATSARCSTRTAWSTTHAAAGAHHVAGLQGAVRARAAGARRLRVPRCGRRRRDLHRLGRGRRARSPRPRPACARSRSSPRISPATRPRWPATTSSSARCRACG